MIRWIVLAALAASLSGCASLLGETVYTVPAPTPENPTPAPVPVLEEDGTTRTVGEELADQIESGGSTVGATAGGVLGGPFGPLAAILGAVGAATAAGALRTRYPGQKPSEPAA